MREELLEWLKYLKELGLDWIILEKKRDFENYKISFLPSEKIEKLERLKEIVFNCKKCRLWEGKKNYVFGEGNPDAEIIFVGEAPGGEEDLQGRPFVGEAGQLLNRIISAMGFKREDVYIGNIIKCRPPQNRTPLRDEIEACKDYIFQQIEIIKPKIIVTLGSTPLITLLGRNVPIGKYRGKWFEWKSIPVMPTFHPAYLVRNPQSKELKKLVWEDMKECLRKLGKEIPNPRKD
jgi:DNA polymerase